MIRFQDQWPRVWRAILEMSLKLQGRALLDAKVLENSSSGSISTSRQISLLKSQVLSFSWYGALFCKQFLIAYSPALTGTVKGVSVFLSSSVNSGLGAPFQHSLPHPLDFVHTRVADPLKRTVSVVSHFCTCSLVLSAACQNRLENSQNSQWRPHRGVGRVR